MGVIERSSFARGWVPDADSVNGPRDALVRADNTILDEIGVTSLRPGSAKLHGLADLDVHSLHTFVLSGTRYRMAGAGNVVYSNGAAFGAATMAGSGDVAFGSHLGQIFFARSTTKQKYDGSGARTWGIVAPVGAPTIAAVTADTKTFATCNSGESPAFTYEEDDGSGAAFATGQDGTANGAIVLFPDEDTGRGAITKEYAAETDFTVYDAAAVGTDNDLLELFVYVEEPSNFTSLELQIDCNGSATELFQTDYYYHAFKGLKPEALLQGDFLDGDFTATGGIRNSVRGRAASGPTGRISSMGRFASKVRSDKPVSNAGWTKLQVRRGDMQRLGTTSGKDWKTVKAIRLIVTVAAPTEIRFDLIRIAQAPLLGRYKWRYVLVYNTGTYTAKSAPSDLSAEVNIQGAGATVTAPADGTRATQINEIWVYRMGGYLDAFYRTKVQTGVSGTGAVAIADTLSDRDALIANVTLESTNTVPPDDIIDIEGPHFDRLFCLTARFLHPSRKLNPDSYATDQAIRVSGVDETAYWVRKALGGLYIGTSKDIYLLDGTGAELPDGTVDFTLRGLNIDHPPISEAVAQEGNLLVYLANDGWRAMGRAGSQSLSGATRLLYRGQARHDVSAVNLATGRFRGAIAKGQLVAITPEGASTTSSAVLYRHLFESQVWYRHTYTPTWRCVHREPDGTLIASDTAGFIWQLDTGSQDDGALIPVVLRTMCDDGDLPFNRKDPWDVRVRADTGGANATVAFHLDGAGASASTLTVTQTGMGVTDGALNAIAAFKQIQLRVTGSFSTFRWYGYAVQYRERPMLTLFAEPKPVSPSVQRRRFGGLEVVLDTLAGDATVTPVLDDVDQTPITVNTADALAKTLSFTSIVGRDLWAKISKATGFEFYRCEPQVLETFPPQFKGRHADTNAGYIGEKVITAITFRVCTFAGARVFTAYLDGVAHATTLTTTTGADEAKIVHLQFTSAQTATDIGFAVDGVIELYDWQPDVLYRLPLRVKVWEDKPMTPSPRRRRFGGFSVQVNTHGGTVTCTPVLDGVDQTTLTTSSADLLGKTLTFASVVGRDLWCRLTGSTPFTVHSVTPIILEEFPQAWKGRTADLNFGYMGEKVITGIKFKVCTLGAARTFTPIFDGVSGTTFPITTGADEPDTYLHQFTSRQTFTDLGFSVDGNIELYPDWEPMGLYRLPARVKFWENIPMVPSARRRRFGGLTVQLNTHGAAATLTPVVDGVDQTTIPVTTSELVGKTLTFAADVGRDLWARITSATAMTVLDVAPIVLQDLPQLFKGRVPDENAGYAGEKVLTGIEIRACTVGIARTFTAILDGVSQTPTKTVTTHVDEPDTILLQFDSARTATDLGWSVDGDIELYPGWTPLVLYQLPTRVNVWEQIPLTRSPVRRRFNGLVLQINTHGADATVIPVLDGVDQASFTVNTAALLTKVLTFNAVVGRDLWARITSATPMTILSVEPIIVESLPQFQKGQTPRSNAGYDGLKTASGLQVRLCTVGAARVITPVLDGVLQTNEAHTVTTGTDNPDDVTIQFAAARSFVEYALSFDGDVELYDVKPLITAQRPLGIKAWASGPLDLMRGQELLWLREVRLKVAASAPITITPYFDGLAYPAVTVTAPTEDATILTVSVGRGYKGRVPSFTITSAGQFFPHWWEFHLRQTGAKSVYKPIRVPAVVGGQVVG